MISKRKLPQIFGSLEDTLRMIAPALMRRRVRRGMRWLKNPSGRSTLSNTFLVAHGFMHDEIAPQSALSFLWEETTRFPFQFT